MGRAYQNRKDSMAKTSDMKARVYSKYAREIYVSAKAGGRVNEGFRSNAFWVKPVS